MNGNFIITSRNELVNILLDLDPNNLVKIAKNHLIFGPLLQEKDFLQQVSLHYNVPIIDNIDKLTLYSKLSTDDLLSIAIENNNIKDVERMIDLGGTDLGGTDLGGTDLGGTDLGGVDLGGVDLDADIALKNAIKHGHSDMLEYLISRLNKDFKYDSFIITAVEYNNISILERLIRQILYGCNCIKDERKPFSTYYFNVAMIRAIKNNYIDIIEKLIKYNLCDDINWIIRTIVEYERLNVMKKMIHVYGIKSIIEVIKKNKHEYPEDREKYDKVVEFILDKYI